MALHFGGLESRARRFGSGHELSGCLPSGGLHFGVNTLRGYILGD